MNRTVRALTAFLVAAALVALAAPQATQGQEKKDKAKKKLVEPTGTTPKEWATFPAATGLQMISDSKNYALTALPKELTGSTYLMRTSGDHGKWLADNSLKVTRDATAYAMIRVKYNNKDVFGMAEAGQLEKDGWTAVDAKVATNSPGNENWQWKLWKKDVAEGDVELKLENLKWPDTAVLYFFKDRAKPKDKDKP